MKIHLKLSFLDVVPSTYKLSKYIFLLFIDDAQRDKLTVYNIPGLGGLEWVYKWIIDFHGQFPEWWSSTAPLNLVILMG